MSTKEAPGVELKTLLTGLAMAESPRWHAGRLWFSDWGAQEVVAVDPNRNKEVVVRTPFGLPFCIDWLADGGLLIVAGRENRVVRREMDGSLVTHVALHNISAQAWNEIVVDGRGTFMSMADLGSSRLSQRMARLDRLPMASPFLMAWP